ncbi:hypothetical protein [uncultured Bradyrhizobium sp.]|uniref:hypothetical protein n=1 Tax=uncultured Bradyrhizobium sp. TaxID=199684 RepID=UPI0035CA0C57
MKKYRGIRDTRFEPTTAARDTEYDIQVFIVGHMAAAGTAEIIATQHYNMELVDYTGKSSRQQQFILQRNKTLRQNYSLANFQKRITLSERANIVPHQEEGD